MRLLKISFLFALASCSDAGWSAKESAGYMRMCEKNFKVPPPEVLAARIKSPLKDPKEYTRFVCGCQLTGFKKFKLTSKNWFWDVNEAQAELVYVGCFTEVME